MEIGSNFLGIDTGSTPVAISQSGPVSAPTTMFGGEIPAVQFAPVTPTPTHHFTRMFYPSHTTAMWKSPVFTPVTGGNVNLRA
jgi:hypothetical protein